MKAVGGVGVVSKHAREGEVGSGEVVPHNNCKDRLLAESIAAVMWGKALLFGGQQTVQGR